MNQTTLLARARALDAADPLSRFRSEFHLPSSGNDRPVIYLCGHSLGAAPRAARTLLTEELDDWDRLGVEGHHAARRPWIDYAELLRPALGRLTGASPDEVVAMNSLTVNLHLLMASFYRPSGRRRCILVESGAFSSDRHAVASQVSWHGLDPEDALIELSPPAGQDLLDESAIERVLRERGEEIALVLWPGVQYRTGQCFDLARIAAASHAAGAVCGFDLAHAIGNVPLSLHADGADFAAWCSYKYLNAGPGAIGGAFVHAKHARASLPGLAGWWGHAPETRFRMEPGFLPAAGAAGWQVSNPPIFSTTPLLASLQMFDAAGMQALRARALSLATLVFEAYDAVLHQRLECVTPREAARRGCQLSLRVRRGRDAGRAVFEALTAAGVIADWREPDILRIAPVPLYNTHEEVARCCLLLADVLEQHA